MLTGDNGILTQAQNAKKATERASIIEQVRLDILEKQTEKGSGDITSGELEEILKKYFSNEEENLKNIIEGTTSEGEETKLISKEDETIKIDLSEIYNGKIEEGVTTEPTLTKKWVSKIDGNGEEEFLEVEKTSDGGYIAVGYTTSTDISGLTNKGSADCLIAKYDANGNEEWKKSVGGSKYDWYSGVIEITDGTYIAVGTILSTDVLDKNGNNIGHGYDWTYDYEPGGPYDPADMVAAEGIIGTYDLSGNEITLKVTNRAIKNEMINEGIFEGERATINVMLSSINKMSDGNYVITGKRVIGCAPFNQIYTTAIVDSPFAIKCDKDGNELNETEFMAGNAAYAGYGSSNSPENYKDSDVTYSMWKGVVETEENYIFFGRTMTVGGTKMIFYTTKKLETVDKSISTSLSISTVLVDAENNYILLEKDYSDKFYKISMFNKNDSKIWEKSDIDLKSISKRNEESFVGISGDNKFLVYDMNDGSVLEEYDIPTYENIQAIEGADEFILLRNTNK